MFSRRPFALTALASLMAISGCSDAEVSRNTSLGHEFNVTLYSGGRAVKAWHSTGKVETEEKSDGWFFRDKATGKLVRVSGNVTVEEAD